MFPPRVYPRQDRRSGNRWSPVAERARAADGVFSGSGGWAVAAPPLDCSPGVARLADRLRAHPEPCSEVGDGAGEGFSGAWRDAGADDEAGPGEGAGRACHVGPGGVIAWRWRRVPQPAAFFVWLTRTFRERAVHRGRCVGNPTPTPPRRLRFGVAGASPTSPTCPTFSFGDDTGKMQTPVSAKFFGIYMGGLYASRFFFSHLASSFAHKAKTPKRWDRWDFSRLYHCKIKTFSIPKGGTCWGHGGTGRPRRLRPEPEKTSRRASVPRRPVPVPVRGSGSPFLRPAGGFDERDALAPPPGPISLTSATGVATRHCPASVPSAARGFSFLAPPFLPFRDRSDLLRAGARAPVPGSKPPAGRARPTASDDPFQSQHEPTEGAHMAHDATNPIIDHAAALAAAEHAEQEAAQAPRRLRPATPGPAFPRPPRRRPTPPPPPE